MTCFDAPARPGRDALMTGAKVAAAGLTLLVVAGCGSGSQVKTSVAYVNPSLSPAASGSPSDQYRQAETGNGVLYIGVDDADVQTVVAATCYNSLEQMKTYVNKIRQDNKNNIGAYHDILLDRALFISAFCPGERLEYDRAVRDQAPGIVTLPPAS